jgi:hypothetical protein
MSMTRPASVPGGLRIVRARVRTIGPIIGLLPPGVLGLISWLLIRDNASTAKGVGGFVLGVLAAPGLLVAGIPLSSTSRYGPAILGSLALWLVLGAVAAWRATRRPVAGWWEFWREYLWLAIPTWVGVLAALLVANLVLGQALF